MTQYAKQVQIDAHMWVQIEPGGEYRIHPEGGIVVTYPGLPQRWVRMVDGAYKSSDLPSDLPLVVRLRNQPTS